MRAFPPHNDTIQSAGKSYIEFRASYKDLMCASQLNISSGPKSGQRITLTDKQCKETNCGQPPTGWYASEKMDGLRALWTGNELITRPRKNSDGVTVGKVWSYVPPWFIDILPPGVPLDGEMWMGRGKFQNISGLSNTKVSSKNPAEQIDKLWRDVKFVVFDTPSDLVYEERMGRVTTIIRNIGNHQLKTVEIFRVKSEEHLLKLYTKLTSKGAEGLMLRAPNSPYEYKRSKLLLKMKVQEDAEAVVTGFQAGTGKYARKYSGHDVLGSLICELPNGTSFNIGTGFTDEIREKYWDPNFQHYIQIGATVNFSYMELTSDGIPRHPAFRGVRYSAESPKEAASDYKDIIIEKLSEYAKILKASDEKNSGFKLRSYSAALKALKLADKISSIDEALGVLQTRTGSYKNETTEKPKSSILAKIKDIISTGTCEIPEGFERSNAINELCGIPHIGIQKAKELYDSYEIKSIEQLKSNTGRLNAAQILGLEHHQDLQLRIPRIEMDSWNEILTTLSPGTVTGSYRRNADSCGDVDFMIQGKPLALTQFILKLEKCTNVQILGCFGKGITQWQGLATLNDGPVRHLDIFCYKPEVFPFALLHSTGSGDFNKLCRSQAIKKGYSLSQYGIQRKDNRMPEVKGLDTEREILEFIIDKWVEPSER